MKAIQICTRVSQSQFNWMLMKKLVRMMPKREKWFPLHHGITGCFFLNHLFSLYFLDFLQRSLIPLRIRLKYRNRKSGLRQGPVTQWTAQLLAHGLGTAATGTAQTAGCGLWQREHLLGPVSKERGRTRVGLKACPRARGRGWQVGLWVPRASFLDSLPAPQ